MKSKRTAALLLSLTLFSGWLPSAVHSQERVRIGISVASLGFLPTVLAEKKGFYGKYGLTSEHVLIPCAIATNALV